MSPIIVFYEGINMNNKRIGMDFERKIVDMFSKSGYWVHFISPDARGAQPFDIIIVKDGVAVVGDCKTCKDHIFRLNRLEENQKMAFEKWLSCGNTEPLIFVEHKGAVKIIEYSALKSAGRIDLDAI